MMNKAGFSLWLCKLFWCEAAQATSDTANILVMENTNAPRFDANDFKYCEYLQSFSEMCVTVQHTNKKTRMKVYP